MLIRIVTFGLNIPAESYFAHASNIAPQFAEWPGLLGKWWLADAASGSYGGVYLFASQQEADLSRRTDLFRGMFANPSLSEVTVREFDVLEAPTAVTAPSSPAALPARGGR
jgi:Putative mono-oxygenase ydhR